MYLSDYDKGWVEALIDGEGWIGMVTRKGGLKGWSVRCLIANTNLFLLERAQKILGGQIQIARGRERIGRKTLYWLTLSSGQIGKIFSELNLIVKESQRKLVLEAIPLLAERRAISRNAGDLNRIRLQEIVSELHLLNKRGLK